MNPDLTNHTLDELFALALTTSFYDEEGDHAEGWEAIWELRRRGTRDIFERCAALCASDDPHHREVGADVLGLLGWSQGYPFRDETLPILFQLIATDKDIPVLNAACVALGHLSDERAIPHLLMLKKHPSEEVRFGVTLGLLRQEDERAIDALIELSQDTDTDVRNWATFGLGSQIELDTPESLELLDTPRVRDALYARVTDPDDEIRGEALLGLALRQDARVIEPLLAELQQVTEWSFAFEAAEQLGDARLLPALLKLKDEWTGEQDWFYQALLDAIDACGGER
jgi:HEAT repeat protein